MAKIKDESNPQDDANLPRRGRDQSFGDKEIGSGGARTTTDGRPVGAGSPDGWQPGGRDGE